jgi:hypothetical protein
MDLYAAVRERTGMKESVNQKAMSECQYPLWERKLGSILQNRYGIGIVDCLDEVELIRSFRNGESPVEVAEELERKRGLTDLNDL